MANSSSPPRPDPDKETRSDAIAAVTAGLFDGHSLLGLEEYLELFEEIAEQQDSSVTLSVAGPGDRNGKNLCAEIDYHVYASETDREPIASACAEISGGTATVTLENDDGSTWYGTDTFFYDLEVYVDMDASGELSWNDYKSYDPFTAKRPSRFDGVSLNINGGFVLNTPPEDQRGEVTVEVVVESLPDPGDLIVEVYENGRFVDGDAPLARFERSIGSTGTVTASLARYLSSAPDLVYSSDEWYGVLGTQYDLVVFVDTNDDNVFDAGSDWRYRELPVNFNQNGDFDLAAYNDTNYGDGTVTYNASGSENDFTQASWN